MKSSISIVWFRRDLRIHDNAALTWALENSSTVIPVFIYSPEEESPWTPGGASRWWLHQSLTSLTKKLAELDLVLNFYEGTSERVLNTIIDECKANKLAYNRLYERHLYDRDQNLEKDLKTKVDITSFDSGLLFTPGSILNNQGLPYRVYTPFYKKVRPLLETSFGNYESDDGVNVSSTARSVRLSSSQSLDSIGFLGSINWYQKFFNHWQPGEDSAHELLETFIENAVTEYKDERDLPALNSTSRLSPYLHFGEITPGQIRIALWPLLESEYGYSAAQSAEVYLKQLIWRDFAHHILWHFPETATQPMNPRYKQEFWQSDSDAFKAWCLGETGIPIVDAGMKQLWETGWMHNRVRMIVSSFLTKNLGISWLDGARWFWDTLVDADLANNSMGWQWVAGCGVDAAPYYRVFNPNTQTKRFDEKLQYIEQWSPDHNELDYPQPMVDLAISRDQAIKRYKQFISS